MMKEDYLIRQSDIIPADVLAQPITVIGAGAIGSFTVLALAKMGFYRIHVYDFDEVSDANMSCQWFRIRDIGLAKVDALKALIHDFTGVPIEITNDRFDGKQPVEGILITAVDSMAARQTAWESIKGSDRVQWLIDPRMASEYALSFVINPRDEKDIKAYETTLYSDTEAVEERCTAKATMYTATMIAGYVAKHVKDLVTGGNYARVTHWNIGENLLQNWPKKKEGEK